mgnify:CR=1 FL=1
MVPRNLKPILFNLIERFKNKSDEFESFCLDILKKQHGTYIRKSQPGFDFGIDLRIENQNVLEKLRNISNNKKDRFLVEKNGRIIVQCKAYDNPISLKNVADSICYADLQLTKKYIIMTNNIPTAHFEQWIDISNQLSRRHFPIEIIHSGHICEILNKQEYEDVALKYFPELKRKIKEHIKSLQNYSSNNPTLTTNSTFKLDKNNPKQNIEYDHLKPKSHLRMLARIDYPYNAGSSNCLKIFIDGKELSPSELINKSGDYEFISGRKFPWIENNAYTLFYSPDFYTNYSDKTYSIKTSGDPYLFILKLPNNFKQITLKHTLEIAPSIIVEILS